MTNDTFMNGLKKQIACAVSILTLVSFSVSTNVCAATVPVPEGMTPVTWEVSEDHLMIEGDEARALYNRIASEDYPTLEELKSNPVVKQLDQLSAYYSETYGDTSKINTPERDKLREDVLKNFITRGSARTARIRDDGSHAYDYDGPLKYEYQVVIVLGLPASGKSTKYADPLSESLGAFNLDSDVIKEMLPEYKESHGAAAQSVHQESRDILNKVVRRFTEGDKKGCNVIVQTIGNDYDELRSRYVEPFENAGYNVKILLADARPNESLARAVMRGLRTGRIITSSAIIGYGNDPQNVYNKISAMTNSKGELYAYAATETSSAYTVVKGDTLYSLAKRLKVTLADLVSWNGISDPNLIYPGQVLKYSH